MSRSVGTTPPALRQLHSGARHPGHHLVVLGILLLMAAYFMVPLVWLLLATTKDTYQLFHTPMFGLPHHLSLWKDLQWISSYNGGEYWRWFLNSVIYSGSVAILGSLLSAMVGYAIAKFRFPGRRLFFSTVVAALMVPGAVLVIPLFVLERSMGLLNSYGGVILPMLISPFGVYFMNVYMGDAMPNELLEAARVDGAGDIQTFVRIVLPVVRPGLITLFLISFIGSWNNFFLAFVLLSKSSLYPVTLGLSIWLSNLNSPGTGVPLYPLVLLGSFLSILPMLILFPFLRRYITIGLVQGSVKA